ncbi:FAD-binding oxidoreductase [Gordonia sp. CPCC 206044]|uniref:FAD-binding protein n=1 Tax=Gordonia sp. CPCC 206044 TaxID=3140793 RepID=UPI003AF3CCF0
MTVHSPSAVHHPELRTSVIAELADRLVGDVFGPDDAGYDAARAGFNLLTDHRPAVIAVPADRFDVVECVRFAADEDLRVAIQATGHGPGTAADGALLINTSAMTQVSVDPVERTATVSAGAKWAPVLEQAQQHGLAPLLGSTTDVGVVGYTLGGGFGWLGRRYGLCSDAVRSFGLVTPSGEALRVSEHRYPEIFWALRGGGAGSIGVVTDIVIDLFPVTTVYAGNLFYPASDAPEIMRRFAAWAPQQSEDLTSSVVLMNFPPLDIVPEPLRGKSFTLVRGCWAGDVGRGASVIDEWRRWKTPELDMWAEIPFGAADAISMDPTDPMPAMVTTEWLNELPDEVIDIVTSRVLPSPGTQPLILFAELRHADGAIGRGAATSPNDLGRTGTYLLEMGSMVPDPHTGLAIESHQRLTRKALAPYVTGATYLNFVEGDEKAQRSASAFGDANRRRLGEIKAALDPDNRFCHGVALG